MAGSVSSHKHCQIMKICTAKEAGVSKPYISFVARKDLIIFVSNTVYDSV
jgi:hypothetical protein